MSDGNKCYEEENNWVHPRGVEEVLFPGWWSEEFSLMRGFVSGDWSECCPRVRGRGAFQAEGGGLLWEMLVLSWEQHWLALLLCRAAGTSPWDSPSRHLSWSLGLLPDSSFLCNVLPLTHRPTHFMTFFLARNTPPLSPMGLGFLVEFGDIFLREKK